MPKNYDQNSIPDLGAQLPIGPALVRIESLEDDEVTTTGKYQVVGIFRVLEPTEMADQPVYERFVIGTDKDPAADDPLSWRGFAAQRYRDMLLKAGVAPTGNTGKDNAEAAGQVLGIEVAHEVQRDMNRDGTPNKYAGNVQSRIKSFFRQGEKAVGSGAVHAPVIPAVAVPKPAAAAVAGVPKPVAPAAKPVATPAKPPEMVKCSICNGMVIRTQFAAHVAEHEAAQE